MNTVATAGCGSDARSSSRILLRGFHEFETVATMIEPFHEQVQVVRHKAVPQPRRRDVRTTAKDLQQHKTDRVLAQKSSFALERCERQRYRYLPR